MTNVGMTAPGAGSVGWALANNHVGAALYLATLSALVILTYNVVKHVVPPGDIRSVLTKAAPDTKYELESETYVLKTAQSEGRPKPRRVFKNRSRSGGEHRAK